MREKRQPAPANVKKWKPKTAALLLVLLLVTFSLCACGTESAKTVEAVPLNEWADSKMVASESDGELHDVQIRFTKVVTDAEEVDQIISAYNTSGSNTTIDTSQATGQVSYCVAYYEVAFPADFPDQEFGITDVAPQFTVLSDTGEETISVENTDYKGLGQTYEIGSVPMGYDFYAGDTYQGAIVYMMVKGYDGYVFCQEYQDGEDTVKVYFSPN